MAINVEYHWSPVTETSFYDGPNFIAQRRDADFISETVKRATEIMRQHNFSEAEICSAETGDLLVHLTTTDESPNEKSTVSADDMQNAITVIKQWIDSTDINEILNKPERNMVTRYLDRIADNI